MRVCVCMHARVIERGLGSVPVSMHSPQSKVNTAALFSSQPSAGSPQARARDHTPRPHTHTRVYTHLHTHTTQTSLQILPHTRICKDHTTPAWAPRTQPRWAVILLSVCMCVLVHVYFHDDGGGIGNTPGSRIRSAQNIDPDPLALAAPTLNIWDWWRIYGALVLGLLTSYLLHVTYITPPFPLTSIGPQQQHKVNPVGVFSLTPGCRGDGAGPCGRSLSHNAFSVLEVCRSEMRDSPNEMCFVNHAPHHLVWDDCDLFAFLQPKWDFLLHSAVNAYKTAEECVDFQYVKTIQRSNNYVLFSIFIFIETG